MPDNLPVTPGTGTQVATDEIGGIHYQRVKMTTGVDGSAVDVSASNPAPVVAGGYVVNPTASFTRPADTVPYAAGDLVANSTTAGSVAPLSLTTARLAAGSFRVMRVKLRKSGLVREGALFRVHFYSAAPTIANGDNGAFSTSGADTYLGFADVALDIAFTDGVVGFGMIPHNGIAQKLASGQAVFALIEARAAYIPANAETFRVDIDVSQD